VAGVSEPARTPRRRLVPPRIAPPIPVLSLTRDYERAARDLGISLMPWQRFAGRFLNAVDDEGNWRYREVAIVAARQNGKTTFVLPYVRHRLRLGRRMLHTAQNREIPRNTFLEVAASFADDPDVTEIRHANGQETIRMRNGGRYTLVAPRPGVRGHAIDDVLLDEVREQRTFELVQAIRPTITASANPQVVYLSNAGDDASVVLNDLVRRAAAGDPELAYLEWSADPDRALDDEIGWRQANPALGITIRLETLRSLYRTSTASAFETEHLCRWVRTMRPRLVSEVAWQRARDDDLVLGRRPVMGIAVAPNRVSVALATQTPQGIVVVDLVEDLVGDVDLDRLGPALNERAIRSGVTRTGFASWTDAPLARHIRSAKALDGREFAAASVNFARLVESGFLRWRGSDTISNDLLWLARKPHESGAWTAVVVDEEHSATAALAAIRASWLASGPQLGAPKIR
jgi:hypothetical protein